MRTGSIPRPTTRLALGGAILTIVLVAAGCSSDGDDDAADTSAETTTSVSGQNTTAGDTVIIEDFAFGDGMPTEIEQGKIVTWENKDSVRHTVTSIREDLFASEGLQPDDVYQHQFLLPGTFDYHCNIHPERMSGTIVVTPTEES